MMMHTQTVFIIDGDGATRDSVGALARSRGLPVEALSTAEELLSKDLPSAVGCVVTEINLAGMSGLGLLAELKAREFPLPVVVLAAHVDVPAAVKAMQAGAVAVLQKPCPDDSLWQAVETALKHEREQRATWRRRRELRARLDTLAPGEMAVMEGLLAGKPNKKIAAELGIGLRTVELRRSRLLKKMQAGSLAELVWMALICGLSPPAAEEKEQDD
jgi:FixJ family two-component response regulator